MLVYAMLLSYLIRIWQRLGRSQRDLSTHDIILRKIWPYKVAKVQIKMFAYPGLALSDCKQPGPGVPLLGLAKFRCYHRQSISPVKLVILT